MKTNIALIIAGLFAAVVLGCGCASTKLLPKESQELAETGDSVETVTEETKGGGIRVIESEPEVEGAVAEDEMVEGEAGEVVEDGEAVEAITQDEEVEDIPEAEVVVSEAPTAPAASPESEEDAGIVVDAEDTSLGDAVAALLSYWRMLSDGSGATPPDAGDAGSGATAHDGSRPTRPARPERPEGPATPGRPVRPDTASLEASDAGSDTTGARPTRPVRPGGSSGAATGADTRSPERPTRPAPEDSADGSGILMERAYDVEAHDVVVSSDETEEAETPLPERPAGERIPIRP